MNAPFLREAKEGVFLAIKLQPRASRERISGLHGDELKVSVTAPPVDAAANRALVEFLAKIFEVSRGQVELARGQTSRHKTILVKNVSAAEIMGKLAPYVA